MDKNSLRIWAKNKRKDLDINSISQNLVEILRKTPEYIKAKNIMIFYPLKNEINLLPLLEDKTKNFYLPKILDKELLCCSYCKDEVLKESCFKTFEPTTEPVDKNILDLVIVPALCCDKNNYRLGYGGGFYDRFLSDKNFITITCLPKELIVETIYHETHDIPLNKVVFC